MTVVGRQVGNRYDAAPVDAEDVLYSMHPGRRVDAVDVVYPMHPERMERIRRWANNISREESHHDVASSPYRDVNRGFGTSLYNDGVEHMRMEESAACTEGDAMSMCSVDEEGIHGRAIRAAYFLNLSNSNPHSSELPYLNSPRPPSFPPTPRPTFTRRTSMFSGSNAITVVGGTFINSGGSINVTYAAGGGRTVVNRDVGSRGKCAVFGGGTREQGHHTVVSSHSRDDNCGVGCMPIEASIASAERDAMTVCSESEEDTPDTINHTPHFLNLANFNGHPLELPYVCPPQPPSFAHAQPPARPRVTRRTSVFSGSSDITLAGGTFNNCGGSVNIVPAPDGGRTVLKRNVDSNGKFTVTPVLNCGTVNNSGRGRSNWDQEGEPYAQLESNVFSGIKDTVFTEGTFNPVPQFNRVFYGQHSPATINGMPNGLPRAARNLRGCLRTCASWFLRKLTQICANLRKFAQVQCESLHMWTLAHPLIQMYLRFF